MISLSTLQAIIEEKLLQEHQALSESSDKGLFLLPENALAYTAGRAVYDGREQIFPGMKVDWVLDDEVLKKMPSTLLYRRTSPKGKRNCLMISFRFFDNMAAAEKDVIRIISNADKTCTKLICVLAHDTEQDMVKKQQEWEQSSDWIIDSVRPPVALLNPQGKPAWLWIWRIDEPLVKNGSPGPDDVKEALRDAIKDMQFESLFNVLATIIGLRTNLSPELITPEMDLSKLFKMVFAQEQGVSVEEVYDPVAMAGLTDSQLAADNLLNDLQKVFDVKFSLNGNNSLRTVKQLAEEILDKKNAYSSL